MRKGCVWTAPSCAGASVLGLPIGVTLADGIAMWRATGERGLVHEVSVWDNVYGL
jgi:hypothetical protein